MNTSLSVLTLASLLLAAPASADFAVNIGAITVAPDDSSSNLNVIEQVAGLPAGSTAVGVNSNTQLGLTFDYTLTPNWSVQLIAATPFSHEIKVNGSAIDGLKVGKTKHLPPTLLAQYHFMPEQQTFDPFVGVGLNYTVFFDEQVDGQLEGALDALNVTGANDAVSLKLKSSFGLALQAGVNIKLSDSLGLHLMLSKMDIDTTGRVRVNGNTVQSVAVNIDPYVAMLGLRWTL
ncbi:MAG: outer membrane beta-barrel protein [Gammaproteobacteria bacterium]|nr:outer membrane beta-barrel protein [Gammaproteobacteria bacterium]MBU1555438.1 outer membrane beta-barrel protein [Gammaproteobacteria bacterium]MBU2070358.1 outer membrane beta-barrel protein [Gammaproteobacteria bacterium]MBU2184780.1 outer membrane beta-barrel protein [Gammaproteobacteria bacterium]MBU2203695.1 outer membrane beta-barrel protein [Gammaproteobacteria bacterium]